MICKRGGFEKQGALIERQLSGWWVANWKRMTLVSADNGRSEHIAKFESELPSGVAGSTDFVGVFRLGSNPCDWLVLQDVYGRYRPAIVNIQRGRRFIVTRAISKKSRNPSRYLRLMSSRMWIARNI